MAGKAQLLNSIKPLVMESERGLWLGFQPILCILTTLPLYST